MKKVVALVVIAIAIAWTAAFVDFGEPTSGEPADTAAANPPRARAPLDNEQRTGPPSPSELDKPPPRTRIARNDPEKDQEEDEEKEREDEENPNVARAVAAAERREGDPQVNTANDVEALGDRGQGVLSPQNNALMRKYATEPREQEWASFQERELAKLVNTTRFAPVQVHCRTTVCQAWIQALRPEDFERFLEIKGVRELTGADANAPFSLRGARLSFYFEPPTD